MVFFLFIRTFSLVRTSNLVFFLILFLGLSWIFITDILVANILAGQGVDDITYWQMFKGSLFVFIIGLVAFVIVRIKERRIEQSDKVFIRLFHNNPNPMWIYDTQSLSFLAVNQAAVDNYGYSEHEFQHMRILDIRPEAEKRKLETYLNTPPDERDMDRTWIHITKSGVKRQIKTAAFDVLYNGQKGRLVTITDLTKLYQEQQAEIERLQQEKMMKQQLETLINSTDDIMWSIDEEKRFLSFNVNFAKWFQRLYQQPPDIGGFVFTTTIEGEDEKWWEQQYTQALRGQEINVTRRFQVEQQELYVEFDFLPIIVDEQVIGVACFGKDISFYLRTINNLQYKNEGLNDIAFIGAHELRKPVANILGLLPLVRKASRDKEVLKMLDMMDNSTLELDSYIRKIIAKVEEIGAKGALEELRQLYQRPSDE